MHDFLTIFDHKNYFISFLNNKLLQFLIKNVNLIFLHFRVYKIPFLKVFVILFYFFYIMKNFYNFFKVKRSPC